ncbi:GNAT family N-acetyltransferase [Devosia sediminis]|uniref:GNAT family N-acetyltransferase n=1 Tax=Devosia sediminis TaxID=2798801 RepID=UPI001F1FBE1A|nr:GNAT family N-acetyltransferase [Devosia sediminis]
MHVPRLETDRLVLRAHCPADFHECLRLWSDENVTKYITGRPSTSEEVWGRILRYAGHWELLGYGYFLVEDKFNQALVGEVGIAHYHRDALTSFGEPPEAGWALLPRYQGLGLAREALTAVLSWAEKKGLRKTTCRIDPRNLASIKLAKRLGYEKYDEVTVGDLQSVLLQRG